jgi:hypothetical protein
LDVARLRLGRPTFIEASWTGGMGKDRRRDSGLGLVGLVSGAPLACGGDPLRVLQAPPDPCLGHREWLARLVAWQEHDACPLPSIP